MTHEEARALLDAWLDNELDAATALQLEAHLNGCGECDAWVRERRELLQRIHDAALPLPAGLRSRIEAGLLVARRRALRWPEWAGALAASALLAVGGFLLGRGMPRPPDLRAELVDASVRAMLSAHPIDVQSSDHHTVKPWLSGQLPFSPPVPELSAADERLLGGRIDHVGGSEVAALLYEHGHHRVTVYLWPRTARPPLPSGAGEIDGYRVLSAQSGEFAVAMVSDMSAAELVDFRARWIREAAAAGGRSNAGGAAGGGD